MISDLARLIRQVCAESESTGPRTIDNLQTTTLPVIAVRQGVRQA
ncbi:MAG: hypothetical protein QOF36_2111 [Microbacteriaceae bacterium]|nr:hypothetical protein [Microbacteriaceae bacterium]